MIALVIIDPVRQNLAVRRPTSATATTSGSACYSMDIISPRQSKVKLGNLDLRKEGRQLPASWRAAETHHVAQMIYFTSDTHFGDPRVLQIDRRPFPDMTAHDLALIENWNERVGDEDDVWHLGDFMSARAGDCDQLLARLNGRKHLIVGNNDPPTTTNAKGWASIQYYAEFWTDDRLLILCHYAFRTWNQMGRKSINLHGHSHGRMKPLPRQHDVGVDAQGLRPVTLSSILTKGEA